MKKKLLVLSAAVLLAGAQAVYVGSEISTVRSVFAEAETYEEFVWSTTNGDANREKATAIENGYSFNGVSSGALASDKKVYLDGLEFDFSSDARAVTSSYGVGLSFVQDTTYAGTDDMKSTRGVTLNLNRNAGGSGQDRITITGNAVDCDWSNEAAACYNSMDAASPTGLSDAGGIVAAYNAEAATAVHVKIERVNADWWKVTLTGRDQYFWGSNNYNLNAAVNETFTYVKSSDLNLDDDGAAYLTVQFRGSGAEQTATLTCVKNGTKLDAPVPAESITLNAETASVDEGDTVKLSATVLPAEAANKKVTWTSSDESIATVSNGVVTGVKAGTAKITATTVDGGFVDECDITVAALSVNAKWKVSNGDPTREIGYTSPSTGGDKVQVGGPGADLYYEDKYTLDGFEFDFGNKYQAGLTNSAFYFSTSTDPSDSKVTFTLEHCYRNSASQTRLSVNTGGYSDTASCAYTTNNLDGGKGLSQATSLVFNSLAEDETLHFKFEHTEYSWWKVTVSETDANASRFMWGSVNYNVGSDAGKTYATFYLYDGDLDLDENGAAYLHVRNEQGTTTTMTINNVSNGTYHEIEEPAATEAQLATVKEKINNISFAGYSQDEVTTYEALRTTALAECDADGVKFSQLNTIYSELVDDIHAAHLASAFAEEYVTYPEEADTTANWNDRWGVGTKAIRLNDDGGVMMNVVTSWGARGKFASTYDLTNFEIAIDFSAMTTGNIGALSFNLDGGEDECSYISPDSGKLFSFDLYKYADGEYTITLSGATQGHNESVEGFSNGATHHPQYTGRIVNSFSNILIISVTTDYETGRSVVTINDQEVELDSALLFGTAPTEKVNGFICLGAFSTSTAENIRVNYVKDADSIARATQIANAISSMDEKAAALATTDALTDDTYAAYVDSFDTTKNEIEALIIATPANDNAYLTKYAAPILENLEAPINVYKQALADAKTAALASLTSYFNEDLYDDDGYDACLAAITNGNKAINAATSLKEVETKLADGKAAIDAVAKKADKEQTSESTSESPAESTSEVESSSTTSEEKKTSSSTTDVIDEAKKGCGSAAIPSVIGLLTIAGALVASKKRK